MKRIALFLLLLCLRPLGGQALPLDPVLDITTLPLYDAPPPGTGSADQPTLTVFLPQPRHSNTSAVVIAPGGAYTGLASNLEGRQIADWFTARGFTAFVLKYRFGPHNIYPIPLLDAQRAIRLVRSRSAQYGFPPNRVGMVGFSAGGHLAATTATLFQPASPAASNAIDRLSDRPDFLVLGYPWLNAMEPQQAKEITYCSLLHAVTPAQCAAFATQYTPKLHVSSQTPPTFIFATTEDDVVPVRASTQFYDALLHAGVSVEMHLFAHGPHGTGLGGGDAALDLWPVLLDQWLRAQGLLTPDPAIPAH